ncbi:MAG: hypothetical protein ACP5GJ_04380 [Nanopusillaceae archaeon]|jgi:hypothetical protein
MNAKSKLLGEIKYYLEKFRKRGLEVNIREWKTMMEIEINYINFEKQKEIINELIKVHEIKKKYLRNKELEYFNRLLEDYLRIRITHYFINKKLNELKRVRDGLKSLYENYDENEYLEQLKSEIEIKFNRLLEDIKDIENKEKEIKRLIEKYLKYLNKEIEYDEEIKGIEEWMNKGGFKNSKLMRIIKDKIKSILNNKNIKLFWFGNGMILVMVYENKYFYRGWIYENNKFYVIDLRNNKYMDVSNFIGNRYGGRILKMLGDDRDRDIIYDIRERSIYDFLV